MGFWHAKAAKKAGGRLSAIVDLNLDTAQRLAASYRNARSFNNVEEMLDQVNLDVLHVCTPVPTHKEIAELAIDAGLNLIIEKSITPMASDIEYLFDKAADRGVLICPVHQFIFQEGVRKARELLPQIGRLVHMEGTFCSAGGTGLVSGQLDEIISDILPHPLSLMQVFLPRGLSEEDWITLTPAPGELHAISETSGISLSIFISMNVRPTVCSFQIAGTEGTIHIDLFHGFAFIEPGKVSRTKKILHPFNLAVRRLTAATVNIGQRTIRWEIAYPGLQQLVRLFYRAVRKESAPPISREDALTVSRAGDRLIQNAGLVDKVQGLRGL